VKLNDQRSLGEGGFMLLEVIMATMLLAIGLFALIEGLGRCVASAASIRNYAKAETLLANKSYEFRAEQPPDTFDREGAFDDEPGITWTKKFETTDTEGLFQQTITVYWYERGKLSSDSVVEYRYLPQKQP
jgi:Tfp pilus assembly protein PilV